MTKTESKEYIITQLTNKAAELAPSGYEGYVFAKHQEKDFSVTMSFGGNGVSVFVKAQIYGTGNVRVAARVTKGKKDAPETVYDHADMIYFYKDINTKTDIKRWCVEKFAKKAGDALAVFAAEQAKAGRFV